MTIYSGFGYGLAKFAATSSGSEAMQKAVKIAGEAVLTFVSSTLACGPDPSSNKSLTPYNISNPIDVIYNIETSETQEFSNNSNCIDHDGDDPAIADKVSYLGTQGWKDIYDTCKSPQLLMERVCGGYQDENTLESELTRFVMCECKEGKCVDKTLNPCTDPLPDQPPEGGAVWAWSTGKVVLDYCESDNSVRHITCDTDGNEKQDVTPCPPDLECISGLCGGQGCYDDDPNDDPTVKGAVNVFTAFGGYTLEDECVGLTKTLEIRCDGNKSGGTIVKSCPDGTYCDEKEGRCLESVDPPCILECHDDEPEANPFLFGTLTKTCNGTVVEEHKDSCNIDWTTSGGVLSIIQWNCDSGHLATFCPTGSACFGGKCIEGATVLCVKKEEKTTFEIIFPDNLRKSESHLYYGYDHCNDPDNILEYYCLNDKGPIASRFIPCPENTFCDDSKLHPTCNPCTDTDPTDVLKVRGTVVDAHGKNQSDYCVGNKIVQVNCNDGEIDASSAVVCPSGTICNEGECK